jgi:hypothetical protein
VKGATWKSHNWKGRYPKENEILLKRNFLLLTLKLHTMLYVLALMYKKIPTNFEDNETKNDYPYVISLPLMRSVYLFPFWSQGIPSPTPTFKSCFPPYLPATFFLLDEFVSIRYILFHICHFQNFGLMTWNLSARS